MSCRRLLGRALLCSALLAIVACSKDDPAPTSPTSPSSGTPKWRTEVLGQFRSVWGRSQTDVFAGGPSGTALHFNGTGWRESYLVEDRSNSFSDISGSSQYVFASTVGGSGAILRYDGSQWTPALYPANTEALSLGTDTTGIAVGNNPQAIFHYDGSAWKQLTEGPAGTPPSYYAVWCARNGEAFIGTALGLIYRYRATVPTEWTRYDLPRRDIYGLWGDSNTSVFAVGDSGSIYHFNGSSWDEMSSGTGKILLGVWGTSYSDVYAVGEGGTILHFDGSTWSLMDSNTADNLFGVWLPPGGDPIAVGGSGIYRRSVEPLLKTRRLP